MKRTIILSAILLFATITMAQVSESSLSYREYILQKEIMYDVLGMYLQSDDNSSYTDNVTFHNAHENTAAARLYRVVNCQSKDVCFH